jgi:hypothetical protein
MANADFADLFKKYPNRNAELRAVAKSAYEFGKTVAQEADAALGSGMHEWSIGRQNSYLDYMTTLVEAIHAKPIPDLPATHPTGFNINLAEPYDMFVEDINGENVPLNEQTELLAQYWMLTAVELSQSQSASMAGSLTEHDYKRAISNIGVMRKLLKEMTSRPVLDLPETSVPGSELTNPTSAGFNDK